MKVHHMGIVVQDLPESIHFFKTLMGAETLAITQESRDTSNRMLRVGDELINLIQPRGTDSEIYDFLIQHGEGLHHLSIVVDDIEKTIENCQADQLGIYDGNYIQPSDKSGLRLKLMADPALLNQSQAPGVPSN